MPPLGLPLDSFPVNRPRDECSFMSHRFQPKGVEQSLGQGYGLRTEQRVLCWLLQGVASHHVGDLGYDD